MNKNKEKNKIKFSEMLNNMRNSENVINRITTNVNMLVNRKNFSSSNIRKLYKNFFSSNTNNLYKRFFSTELGKFYKNISNVNFNEFYKNISNPSFSQFYKNVSSSNFNEFYKNIGYSSLLKENSPKKALSLNENYFKNTFSDYHTYTDILFPDVPSKDFSIKGEAVKQENNYPKIFSKSFYSNSIYKKGGINRNIFNKNNFLKEKSFSNISEKIKENYSEAKNQNGLHNRVKNRLYNNYENMKFNIKDKAETVSYKHTRGGNISVSPNINVELSPRDTFSDFNKIWLEIGNKLNSELNASAGGIH